MSRSSSSRPALALFAAALVVGACVARDPVPVGGAERDCLRLPSCRAGSVVLGDGAVPIGDRRHCQPPSLRPRRSRSRAATRSPVSWARSPGATAARTARGSRARRSLSAPASD